MVALACSRFSVLPNVLKILQLIFTFIAMLLTGSATGNLVEGYEISGTWFFWLTTIIGLVFTALVIALFCFEMEEFLLCGRMSWPGFEMGYSVLFMIFYIVCIFLNASWYHYGRNGAFGVSALFCLINAILYGLGALLMYRIWMGFGSEDGMTSAPAPQTRPTVSAPVVGPLEPGNVGQMHPGF